MFLVIIPLLYNRHNFRYVFVVRAENAKGIGMPSPVSELMRTRMSPPVFEEPQQAHLMTLDIDSIRQKLVSEQLIKLKEVNSVNSTAMQLVWKRQRKVEYLRTSNYVANKEDFRKP